MGILNEEDGGLEQLHTCGKSRLGAAMAALVAKGTRKLRHAASWSTLGADLGIIDLGAAGGGTALLGVCCSSHTLTGAGFSPRAGEPRESDEHDPGSCSDSRTGASAMLRCLAHSFVR